MAETFTFPISLGDNEDDEKEAEEAKSPEEERVLNETYVQLKKAAEIIGRDPESLDELAKLDTCVTVVDALAFSGNLTTPEYLLER